MEGQFIWGYPPTSQSWSGSTRRNGLKLLHVIVQDWSTFTGNVTFSYCSKRGSHRYWKQRFTPFCNAQICNTGSFFSINTWQRKYFSLTCLIRFSLPTFRIYMKIWWCFGSYLCRNIENSKDFTNFQAALYIYIYKRILILNKSMNKTIKNDNNPFLHILAAW